MSIGKKRDIIIIVMRMNWRKIWQKPGMNILGGFAIAGIAMGILILIFVVFIQPISSPEKIGTVHYREGPFVLWYQKDSPARLQHTAEGQALKQEYNTLITLLDISPKLIPTPIDVFIHDDVAALQASILKRENPSTHSSYAAPLDLLVGENPAVPLAELILAFGWGQCGSWILRTGMSLYAADPNRNFYAVVAALPARLFITLPELTSLAANGRLPESIYYQFDSPYSPATIQLSNFKSLYDITLYQAASPSNIPGLESASLVQFLIATHGGITAIRRAWGLGTTAELIHRIDPAPLAQISMAWRKNAITYGKNAPGFSYLQAYYLMGNGDPDGAWQKMQAWNQSDLSQEEILLKGRCAIAIGKFSAAAGLLKDLTNPQAQNELQGFVTLFQEWRAEEVNGVRILIPPEMSATSGQQLLTKIAGIYGQMRTQLSLSPAELPERLTIFLYPDEALQNRGVLLTPLSSTQNGTLHLVMTDDIPYELGQFLPGYAWGVSTYSHLLRAGIAVAISRNQALLVQQACNLRRSGNWVPLQMVDFDVTSAATVKIEAGVLIQYVLAQYGARDLRDVWVLTSPANRYLAFDTALKTVCNVTREQIEKKMFSSLLSCKGEQG